MNDPAARVAELFDRSKQISKRDLHTQTLLVGGSHIRLSSAGPAMLDFVSPALAHLPRLSDEVAADLTITLWDAKSNDESFPDLRLPEIEPLAVATLNAPGLLLSYRSNPDSMTIFNCVTNEALVIVDDLDEAAPWEQPSPMRALFAWWFAHQGKLLSHAAAVATDSGAALLIGKSGSGKSSTSLACMAAGMKWLGDDYVVIDPVTQTVSSLYGSARLISRHHDLYPDLMRTKGIIPQPDGTEKHYGFPAGEFPDRVCLDSPIRAAVLPVVTGASQCQLSPSTRSRALLALAPTTIFQGGILKAEVFELARAVVEPLSPYRLELGGGVEAVPKMLSELILRGTP